jgi:hypothetical protein
LRLEELMRTEEAAAVVRDRVIAQAKAALEPPVPPSSVAVAQPSAPTGDLDSIDIAFDDHAATK